MLRDTKGKTYASATEWMKEVARNERAKINTDTARTHAAGCWRFKLAGTERARGRDLAKSANAPAEKIGGARKSV